MKTRLSPVRSLLLATLSLLAVCIMGGCKAYQLGNPTELPFESIFIKPVANDSFAPQAQALLSAQIREAFIRDGRTKVVTSEEAADAVLLVNLTEYNRSGGARNQNDTAPSTSFNLQLVADVSLFNQNKGDYYFEDRELSERSNAYVGNPYAEAGAIKEQDFLQSEYQAMPRLTRNLARKIADEVLSPWPAKE